MPFPTPEMIRWMRNLSFQMEGATLCDLLCKKGKLSGLKVTPESRKKDIVNYLNQH